MSTKALGYRKPSFLPLVTDPICAALVTTPGPARAQAATPIRVAMLQPLADISAKYDRLPDFRTQELIAKVR